MKLRISKIVSSCESIRRLFEEAGFEEDCESNYCELYSSINKVFLVEELDFLNNYFKEVSTEQEGDKEFSEFLLSGWESTYQLLTNWNYVREVVTDLFGESDEVLIRKHCKLMNSFLSWVLLWSKKFIKDFSNKEYAGLLESLEFELMSASESFAFFEGIDLGKVLPLRSV